ncbi:MAG: DUF47 domain-containing protein [Conexivisphaera sp.]
MSFYMGETELQMRRRILVTLQDMTRRLLDGTRALVSMYESMQDAGSDGDVEAYRSEVSKAIGDVEAYRKSLVRQLSEVGAMLINREDVLRTAFMLEDIASYLDSLAFRIYAGRQYLTGIGSLGDRLREMLNQTLSAVTKLNDLSRILQVNPGKVSELASLVEREEKNMDGLYRDALVESLAKMKDFKQLLVYRDVVERVERIADLSLSASEMLMIVSLRL